MILRLLLFAHVGELCFSIVVNSPASPKMRLANCAACTDFNDRATSEVGDFAIFAFPPIAGLQRPEVELG
jgi:hypothetical protein